MGPRSPACRWRTDTLPAAETARLYAATREVLVEWIERLQTETGDDFPEHVTAFREGMAVHGRFGKPCPACGDPVQRIVYAENEANYCATCQTEGRLLADRALSRLLKDDWPRTLEEMEERRLPIGGSAGPITGAEAASTLDSGPGARAPLSPGGDST